MRNIMIVIFITLVFGVYSQAVDNRGLQVIQGDPVSMSAIQPPIINMNTIDSFTGIKANNTNVILVANDRYTLESGFVPLYQCYNDAVLLKSILTVLCKVPEANITIVRDGTSNEFARVFRTVTGSLKPEQGLIISYSGHGDIDGSLVFVDGSRVNPDQLKRLVNSIRNDTTLILDACYSGNNEGPLDTNSDNGYKANSLRIYASLAHMTAKEIVYRQNPFFVNLLDFYRSVLGINIEGNGYFTSLIGYFFAEYDFTHNNNISFRDIMDYINNKGKQYIEYLAMNGTNASRGSTLQLNLLFETGSRLNQTPKMYPLRSQVIYNNPVNEFVLIKKFVYSSGITPELFGGPTIMFSNLFGDRVSGSVAARFTVSPYYFRGFFLSLEFGFIHTYRPENSAEYLRQWDMFGVNFIQIAGCDFSLAENYIVLGFELGGGIAVAAMVQRPLGVIPEESAYTALFVFETGLRFFVYPVKNFGIFTHVQFVGYVLNDTDYLFGLRIPFGFSWRL